MNCGYRLCPLCGEGMRQATLWEVAFLGSPFSIPITLLNRRRGKPNEKFVHSEKIFSKCEAILMSQYYIEKRELERKHE